MRTAKQRSEPDNGPRISEEKKSIKRYPLMVISSVATVQVTAWVLGPILKTPITCSFETKVMSGMSAKGI